MVTCPGGISLGRAGPGRHEGTAEESRPTARVNIYDVRSTAGLKPEVSCGGARAAPRLDRSCRHEQGWQPRDSHQTPPPTPHPAAQRSAAQSSALEVEEAEREGPAAAAPRRAEQHQRNVHFNKE
ncbi:hypothetical protein AGIG_G21538 [Arapaima gigas]